MTKTALVPQNPEYPRQRFKVMVRLRRLIRLAVVGFVFLIPFSSLYANYKMSYNNSRLVYLANQHAWDKGHFTTNVYRALDLVYRQFEDPITAATSNNGTFFSLSVFGFGFADPVGVLSTLVNGRFDQTSYLLKGLIPIAIALILGRVFCSWICPMSFVFALTAGFRRILERWKIPLFNLSLPRNTAGFILIGGLIAAHAFGMWVWHLLLPYVALGHEIYSWIATGGFTIAMYYLVALVALDAMLIPGEFCRSICPTGFLLSAFQRKSLIRVQIKEPVCYEKCQSCLEVCPVNCSPKTNDFKGCHTCGLCLAACPSDKLRVGVYHSLKAVVAMILVTAGLMNAPSAQAHHYKGLPHYGYFENYPHVPTLEFLEQIGHYEVLVTVYNFQGMNLDQVDAPEDVRFYIYIFDLEAQKTVSSNVRFQLVQGDKVIFDIPDLPSEQENIYVINRRVAEEGTFDLNVSFKGPDEQPVRGTIELRISPGFLKKNGMYIGLGIFFVGVVVTRMFLGKHVKTRARKIR